MIAFCKDKRRRNLVLQTPGVNGLDYLEILDSPGCGKRLALSFVKDARSLSLNPDNVVIAGGTVVQATNILPATDEDPLSLIVQLDKTGDFSPYTLTLVTSSTNNDPPPGIDRQLNSLSFSFKAGCPTPLDCLTTQCCPSDLATPPDIHYLARDYDAFRQAMLDRMSVLLPEWTERHEADPGIALVEVLAFAADHVSYLQDAVNTEAYIGTARSRISLRRHARLVDYQVSEGANARGWVCLSVNLPNIIVPAGTQFFPQIPGIAASVDPNDNSYAASLLLASPGPVFESMETIPLYPEQSQMDFYTWGDGQCCLPAGATQATLTGTPPNGAYSSLKAGQVLIFEEMKGPQTGDPADADPAHRWAVRLTYASTVDNAGHPLFDPVNPGALLTSIAWNVDDALPFPLCLSSISLDGLPVAGVSVARGNVVATNQGVWTIDELLGAVPPLTPSPVSGIGCNCLTVGGAAVPRARFEAVLANQPLTFAVDYNTAVASAEMPSAASFLAPDNSTAKPQISLSSDDGQSWSPVEDLLSKDNEFAGFIPEVEWDGSAHLRFGDGTYGQAPKSGVNFTATYRTGNGASGNVGRDALAHVLMAGGAGITRVRNPLAASGGADPETMQHIVQVAPFAFQTQMRCVTAADYGAMAKTLNGVAKAQGNIRWTGSWYSAFVSVDPAVAWTDSLATQVETGLSRLRMMGTDLVVQQAIFVGLRIGLKICVAPGFFQSDVYQAIWKLLVTGDTCQKTIGMLDAANFQFGQTVYASPIVAAAQSITGVAAITLVSFERMDRPVAIGSSPPTQLLMGSIEIPCCNNDPNHADRGMLILTMDGGK